MVNDREDKNGRRWTTFEFEVEKKSNFSNIYRKPFFNLETKSSLSTSIFIFSTITQIKKKIMAKLTKSLVILTRNFLTDFLVNLTEPFSEFIYLNYVKLFVILYKMLD